MTDIQKDVNPKDENLDGETLDQQEAGGESQEEDEGSPSGNEVPPTSPEEVEKLKKAKDDLLQQLISERKKRQEAEAQQQVPPTEEELEGEDDTEKQVIAILKKKEMEQVNSNRVKALEKFWEENPQYSPSNDLTGLNMDRINQVIKERINTSNSKTVEEIVSDYNDAIKLIGQTDKKQNKPNVDNSGASMPNVPSSPSANSGETGLTSAEKKVAERVGISEKRYKELKSRYPNAIL